MLTPKFSSSQDESNLFITIQAQYAHQKDLQIHICENEFKFVCTPYVLRLKLSGKIIEDDNSTVKYDSDAKEFRLTYQKQTKNESFADLCLVMPFDASKSKEPSSESDEYNLFTSLSDNEIFVIGYSYGFGNYYSDVLDDDKYCKVTEIRNVLKWSPHCRRTQRIKKENNDFSKDHYLADLIEDDEIYEIIQLEPNINSNNKFTNDELEILNSLPNKSFSLNKEKRKKLLFGLTDILFAYCYDRRTTYYEGTCESGWTITKISATLSWFEEFENFEQVLIASFRRSLTYPLYRNFDLCEIILQDLKNTINTGAEYIIKCLLDIHSIFDSSFEPRDILNDLYIKDYINFVQKCTKDDFVELASILKETHVEKSQLNLDLFYSEQANNSELDIQNALRNLSIQERNTSSCEESSSDSYLSTSVSE